MPPWLPGGREHRQRRADIGLTRRVRDPERLVVHADMVGRHVEQVGPWRECRRLLVLGAERRRADALGVLVLPGLEGRVLLDDLRTPVLRAVLVHHDAGGPVDLRVELVGDQQLAGHAIERVAEAVAVEVDESLARLAATVDVGEDHLVDAVIVPLVERRHLVGPLRHAGVDVTGDDRHGPFLIDRLAVRAGALNRVPGRRIGGAVEDQVGLGIIREPAPGRAAADLPLIAGPGLERGVLADRLAERHGLLGIEQRSRCPVRAYRRATPACRSSRRRR